MNHRWLALVIVTSLLIATAPTASAAAGPATSPNDLITRTYAIRDLLWVMSAPNYSNVRFPAAATAAASPATQPDFAANAARFTRMLRDALPAQIDGSAIVMTNDGVNLTVTTPAATQVVVADAFEKLRSDMLVQVSDEASIYSLPPATFQRLSFSIPKINRFDDATGILAMPLSEEQVDELQMKVMGDRQASRLSPPRLTLFNHQKALILVQTEQAYVSGYTFATRWPDDVQACRRDVPAGWLLVVGSSDRSSRSPIEHASGAPGRVPPGPAGSRHIRWPG
ncbi:MAG TPA: hypothetical protein VLI90_20845 [Tepidisphaeraceae bacterium]|nr:hypothetical protein [Tepidisphaeraceae bacterium]